MAGSDSGSGSVLVRFWFGSGSASRQSDRSKGSSGYKGYKGYRV